MGKRLNLERKEKRSGMKQVYNVAASAFFFQSHTIFPLLSLPLLVLYPMPSHLLFSVFFTFSVFTSGSGALIWEVELVCHGVN